jgi:hypothetical protein
MLKAQKNYWKFIWAYRGSKKRSVLVLTKTNYSHDDIQPAHQSEP